MSSRKQNSKTITKDELRNIQLDMLRFVDSVCRKNNIEYSLAGGSLLGAIRHGGYIPWDDDIDIELTRSNYDQLLSALVNSLPTHYSLIYYKVSEAYLPFAKLYDNRTFFTSTLDRLHLGTGVFLDIFPMDILPDDDTKRAAFKKEFRKKAIQLTASNPRLTDYPSSVNRIYYLGKLVLWLPYHLKYSGKSRQLAASLDSYMQTYANTDNHLVSYLYTGYKNAIFPKEIWEEYEDVSFENLTVRKLKNHDTYLTLQYGDYMQLPPENKRITHSYYHWYWKEEKE